MFKQIVLINNILPQGGIILHLKECRNLNVINSVDNLSSLVHLEILLFLQIMEVL